MKPLRILTTRLVLILLAGFYALGVQAAQLQIQFTGVNLEYFVFDDTGPVMGDIFDGTLAGDGYLGGDGDPANADPLSFMDFLVDGVSVGTQASDIYFDTYIQDVWNIPVAGGTVQSEGNIASFGFDLLTEPNCTLNCWGLGLQIDTVQVSYNGSQISIQGSGAATGVFQQALPFNLELDNSQPITFDFTGTSITNLSDNGSYLTGFNLAGTGTITGTLVPIPVPAAFWLFGSGMLGLVAVARRLQKS